MINKLGSGAYGNVYHARNIKMNYKECAIKMLSKTFIKKMKKVPSVFRERNFLSDDHCCNFIPKFYDWFMDNDYVYVVMEYIPNGSLHEITA